MKKAQGFTLVELLATITILGILCTIGFTTYKLIQNKSLETNYNSKINIAEKAAFSYGNDFKDEIWELGSCKYITIPDLINNGYLASDSKESVSYINPKDNTEINDGFAVCLDSKNSIYVKWGPNDEAFWTNPTCDISMEEHDEYFTLNGRVTDSITSTPEYSWDSGNTYSTSNNSIIITEPGGYLLKVKNIYGLTGECIYYLEEFEIEPPSCSIKITGVSDMVVNLSLQFNKDYKSTFNDVSWTGKDGTYNDTLTRTVTAAGTYTAWIKNKYNKYTSCTATVVKNTLFNSNARCDSVRNYVCGQHCVGHQYNTWWDGCHHMEDTWCTECLHTKPASGFIYHVCPTGETCTSKTVLAPVTTKYKTLKRCLAYGDPYVCGEHCVGYQYNTWWDGCHHKEPTYCSDCVKWQQESDYIYDTCPAGETCTSYTWINSY